LRATRLEPGEHVPAPAGALVGAAPRLGPSHSSVSISAFIAARFVHLVELQVSGARARGEEIVVSPANTEVSPTEAAVLLAMSRPQVRKLMDRGLLEFRKVGTHHRIRVSSIRAFLETERERRREALAELAVVQNELGLT
jgi:excisionase family DNA binding protein